MSYRVAGLTLFTLFLVPILAYAQTQPLPSQLKGRWTYQGRLTNIFSLSEIKETQDKSFTAKVEWWTANLNCAVRGEPISGSVTDKGLTWDLVTKSPCNDPYTIELIRGDKGWEGKAVGRVNNFVVDLKAE